MIERYQVSAVPIGGGDRITGYFVCIGGASGIVPQFGVDNKEAKVIPVDLTTIEPVRVSPNNVGSISTGISHECPNCSSELGWEDYCPFCGMALDWSDT